ncbi:myosin phosphatase Rho-interacting protein-like [Anarrhichthys ocellatus]|nr:myosin phosphatase Rho-interacting protein-like [Anarrhichthys ocellatus]
MSGEKATSPCNKFQANIFNKSKCQNCFKSRELHLLTDHGMEQAKPLYGGWLCLAPEGTDFDNPMQKSRKWQRRFFILYEDGSLSFALDELVRSKNKTHKVAVYSQSCSVSAFTVC